MRNFDCKKYTKCLEEAAKANIDMNCVDCRNGAILKLDANKLYLKAVELRTGIEKGFFELGAILQEMFIKRFFHGYASWKEFVANDDLFKELDIKFRSVDYLRSIYLKFTELKISREDCAKVGYTKLAILLPVVTQDNVKDFIEMAKGKGMTQKLLVNKIKGRAGESIKQTREIYTRRWIDAREEIICPNCGIPFIIDPEKKLDNGVRV